MRSKMFTAAALLSAAMLLGLTGHSQAEVKLAATSSISGKVLDGEGKAVAGAMVRVLHKEDAKPAKKEKNLDDGEKPKKKEKKAIAQGRTDDSGAFKLDVPAGEYVVMANLKGSGVGRAEVTVADGASATVEIKLKERAAKPAK
jgi:hypothetical protein